VEKEKQSIAAAEKGKHLKNYQMKLKEERCAPPSLLSIGEKMKKLSIYFYLSVL
jgi:hypothetical protein